MIALSDKGETQIYTNLIGISDILSSKDSSKIKRNYRYDADTDVVYKVLWFEWDDGWAKPAYNIYYRSRKEYDEYLKTQSEEDLHYFYPVAWNYVSMKKKLQDILDKQVETGKYLIEWVD